jgi:ketosteroid isomerase-like protein
MGQTHSNEEESMKKRMVAALVVSLVAAVLLLAGCASMAKGSTEEDVEAIREIWKTYASARVDADAQLWLSLWDEEGVQMPPGSPARGMDVLRVGVPKAFVPGSVSTMNIYPEEITVAGGWAYSRGTYNSNRTVEGKTVRVEGKFLTILRKQSDGSWKIYRDCFNSNTP